MSIANSRVSSWVQSVAPPSLQGDEGGSNGHIREATPTVREPQFRAPSSRVSALRHQSRPQSDDSVSPMSSVSANGNRRSYVPSLPPQREESGVSARQADVPRRPTVGNAREDAISVRPPRSSHIRTSGSVASRPPSVEEVVRRAPTESRRRHRTPVPNMSTITVTRDGVHASGQQVMSITQGTGRDSTTFTVAGDLSGLSISTSSVPSSASSSSLSRRRQPQEVPYTRAPEGRTARGDRPPVSGSRWMDWVAGTRYIR